MPFQYADNAAHAAAIGLGRLDFDEHLIALHCAIDLVGRDEDVFHVRSRLACLARVWAHKAVAVAMQIEASGGQVVARAARAEWPGNAPVLAVKLHQLAADGQPGELFEEQTPFAPAAEGEFAHQLLVSGLAAG